MAPETRWVLLPLALGVGLTMLSAAASADERRASTSAYHRDFHTATRIDPPPAARGPAWGACCDGQSAPWWDESDAQRAHGHWWERHRPDPNRRRIDVPSDGPDGAWSQEGLGWNGWRGRDERARHGWRAGWHGAAPGWGGVWWYGWGGDWPAYAGRWEDGRWYGAGRGWRHAEWRGRGSWHGEFGFGHGWGNGRRVIAVPAPRGE